MVQFGQNFFGFQSLRRGLVSICCQLALVSLAFAADNSRAEQVAKFLAAGEFGPATTEALGASDATERAELLTKVAGAQQAAGDPEAAAGTMRRIAPRTKRASTGDQAKGLAGGGQIDFGTLMNMIRQNTGDPEKWSGDAGQNMTPYFNGVQVSPNGLLSKISNEELSGQLAAMGVRARQAELNEDIARNSDLRMISLTRLEKSVAQRIEEGMPIPESMMRLAGLTRIKFVFVFPRNERNRDRGSSLRVAIHKSRFASFG